MDDDEFLKVASGKPRTARRLYTWAILGILGAFALGYGVTWAISPHAHYELAKSTTYDAPYISALENEYWVAADGYGWVIINKHTDRFALNSANHTMLTIKEWDYCEQFCSPAYAEYVIYL